MEIFKLWGEIEVNRQKAEADIRAVETQAKKSGKEMESSFQAVTKQVGSMGKELTKVGDSLSKKLTVPLAALGALLKKTAIDFESSFTSVRKTVDATEEEFAALSKGIRQMAKEIPASASEIAEVAAAAGQLGIATENILDFTRTMIDLGESTNLSAEQAATSLARLANITGMSQRNFDRLGSVIVALGNSLATMEAEITEMALRLAGAGKQVGMTEAQILALAGALSSVGIEAQAGGSAMSKVIIEMQLAAETGGERLADFARVAGMSAQQFADAFREDATNALMAFIGGLQTAEERGVSTIKVLHDMGLTEQRMRDALLRAAGAGELFAKAIATGTQAWQENTALTNEAAQRYETAASKLEIMRNKLMDVAITLGEILLPPLLSVVEKIGQFADWLGSLDASTQRTILIIAGLAAAIGPVTSAIGRVITGVANLVTWIGKLMPLLSTFAGPIGIAAAALGALGIALAGRSRDTGEYYDKTLAAAQANMEHAESLEKLLQEYQELAGKPDKSEEEHRRLEQVMQDIIKIQPQLAEGYDTIDEAIKRNIGTLQAYIETLKNQSEAQLMQAQIEFMNRRNALEAERAELLQKQADLQGRIGPAHAGAMDLSRQVSELEKVFVQWRDAIERGAEDTARALEDQMRAIINAIWPEVDTSFGMWGKWVFELQKLVENVTAGSGDLVKDLEKVEARIAAIDEELAKGEAIQQVLAEVRGQVTKTTEAVVESVGQQTAFVVEAAEEQSDERTKFEQEWNRKLFELTASRLEMLKEEYRQALAMAVELEADTSAIHAYYAELIKQTEEDLAEAVFTFHRQWDQKLLEAQGKTLEARLLALDLEKREVLKRAEEIGADTTAVEQFYALRTEQIIEEENKAKEQRLKQWRERLEDAQASEMELLALQRDRQLALIEEQMQQELALAGDNEEAKTAIMEFWALERQRVLKEYADAVKAIQEQEAEWLQSLEDRLAEYTATEEELLALRRDTRLAEIKAQMMEELKLAAGNQEAIANITRYWLKVALDVHQEYHDALNALREERQQKLQSWEDMLFELTASEEDLIRRSGERQIATIRAQAEEALEIFKDDAEVVETIIAALNAKIEQIEQATNDRLQALEQAKLQTKQQLYTEWLDKLAEVTLTEEQLIWKRAQDQIRAVEQAAEEAIKQAEGDAALIMLIEQSKAAQIVAIQQQMNEQLKTLAQERRQTEEDILKAWEDTLFEFHASEEDRLRKQAADRIAALEAQAQADKKRLQEIGAAAEAIQQVEDTLAQARELINQDLNATLAQMEEDRLKHWQDRLFEATASEAEILRKQAEERIAELERLKEQELELAKDNAELRVLIEEATAAEILKIRQELQEALDALTRKDEQARQDFEDEWRRKYLQLIDDREALLWLDYEKAIERAKELGASTEDVERYFAEKFKQLADSIWEQLWESLASPMEEFAKAVFNAAQPLLQIAKAIASGNYLDAFLALLMETESFAKMMELLNKVLKPVVVLLDNILRPIIEFLLGLWNAVIDALASISLFGWRPFAGLEQYKVEWDDQGSTKSGRDKGSSTRGRQVTEFTGPSRDLLIDLLSPLAHLAQVVSPLWDIRNILDQRLPNFNASGMEFAAAGAGAMSPAVVIENITVHSSAKDGRQLARDMMDEIEREMARRINFGVRGRGGR